MHARVFFTTQGQIIGEVVDDMSSYSGICLKNPAILVNQGTNVQFIPLGNFVDDKLFHLNPAMLLLDSPGDDIGFEPIVAIGNKYREIFGSGIQIANQMP